MVGGREGEGLFWGSGRGAFAGCTLHTTGIEKKHQKKNCLELLADVTMTQKCVFAFWGLCLYTLMFGLSFAWSSGLQVNKSKGTLPI